MQVLKEKVITEKEVKELLGGLHTSNNRYEYSQFEKLFGHNRVWETFDNKALAALDKDRLGLNDYCINEIQSFEKGYGAKLLKYLLEKYKNIWLLVNPDSSSTLLDYYRKFGLKEIYLKNSIWNKPIYLLYQGNEDLKNAIIKEYNN